MKIGRIRFYNDQKGFGFASYAEGDVFFHIKQCEEGYIPEEDDTVTFDVEIKGDERITAINVAYVEDKTTDFFLDSSNTNEFKLLQNSLLSIKINQNEKFEIGVRLNNGDWIFAENNIKLTNGVYTLKFNTWSTIIKEFEELINTPNIPEHEIQTFLEKYPELLKGSEYECLIPQAQIKNEDQLWYTDFILHPFSEMDASKIIEIKKPGIKMFRDNKSGHQRLYVDFINAIKQLKDYYIAFENEKVRNNFKDKYGKEIYKPTLQLTIGRKWDIPNLKEILDLQSENRNMKILTWDEQIDSFRRILT